MSKNIKQSLSVAEVREMADLLVEMWDDGARPPVYGPQYTRVFIDKLRNLRAEEKRTLLRQR